MLNTFNLFLYTGIWAVSYLPFRDYMRGIDRLAEYYSKYPGRVIYRMSTNIFSPDEGISVNKR